MRIAVVGSPWVPVPPPAYGGTEAVVDELLRGLARAGHDVRYYGHPASTAGVEVRSLLDPADIGDIGDAASELAHVLEAHDDAVAWGADVVHDHTLVGALVGRAHHQVPVVVTNHGPFNGRTLPVFRRIDEYADIVAISHAQAASSQGTRIASVVHHGVDLHRFPAGHGGGPLLFLGRMHPDKGPHRAIRIARRAGRPIRLAAKMREPAERAFFDEHVRPLLGEDAVYEGEVDAHAKLELLAEASALLNPISWPEPFGMVMLEALACATPVVTAPIGAAPEIVDDGVTGFLCADEDAFVAALEHVETIDRSACRAAVAERFTVERMVQGYLEVFGCRCARGGVSGAQPPRTAARRSARAPRPGLLRHAFDPAAVRVGDHVDPAPTQRDP